MRVVLISFDALDSTLVDKYNCRILKQKYHGKIDLEPYFRDRPQGIQSREALTPEVYATFVTGKVIGDMHTWSKVIQNSLSETKEAKHITDSTISSMFSIAGVDDFLGRSKAFTVDLPCIAQPCFVNKLTGLQMFGRYFKDKFTLDEVEREYYKYAEIKTSYGELINKLDYDLILFYYQYTDKLGHIYLDNVKYDDKIKAMYRKTEEYAKRLIDIFDDGNTLIIIFSDHGMFNGHHTANAFWSSNKDLNKGNIIKITSWKDIIEKWYSK